MNKEILEKEVAKLVEFPKGILAIDESIGTCGRRFEKLGVENTIENRRKYREMLVTAPGVEEYLSGYIVVPETAEQKTSDGRDFREILKEKGISMGVNGYTGYSAFDTSGVVTQEVTEGIGDFDMRAKDYRALGSTFSKWRMQIRIGGSAPTEEFLKESAKRLARYAQICQAEDMVPIVEPEVLIDGDHTIDECYDVTERSLKIVFSALEDAGVYLPGTILKTSMVLSGKDAVERAGAREVAEKTLKCLKENVPNEIGGIVFLSGGQSEEEATEHLRLMHEMDKNLPWALTFSYGRAIQGPALKAWAHDMKDMETAQKLLLERARANSDANKGE